MSLIAVAGVARAADTTVFGAAGVTQSWLGLETDIRDLGLGGAVGTLVSGNAALEDNPAGLDFMVDPEISVADNEWSPDLGLREDSLSYGSRAGDGAFAASFRYFNYGTFDNRDANGAPLGATVDDAYAGTLGYGQSFWDDALSLGAALTSSQEVISDYSTSLYLLSLGANYAGPLGLRLAAAALNEKLSGNTPYAGPASTRLSLGWMSRNRSLQLDADWQRPQAGDGTISVGGEWTLAGNYSIRAGWRFAQGEGSVLDAGPSVGAGLRFGDLRFDYAFVPYGPIGNTQQIGATLYLGSAFFGKGDIIIEAAGNSAEAIAFYEQGMAAFKGGDWAEAKVRLQDAVKLRPEFGDQSDVKQTLADADKRLSEEKATIAAAKAKGSNNAEARAYLSRKLLEAKAAYAKGDLVEAMEKLKELFEFDSSLQEGVSLQRRIEQDIAAKVDKFKNAAVTALQDGDLVSAVVNYRGALKLAPGDKDIRDSLVKLSPKVETEVRRLHREGIDAYINNDLDRAITLWQQALDLDPSDPRNIKRDMDKAKKMKALRTS